MIEASASMFQPRQLECAHGRSLTLGPQGVLMAIVNVTPDSFSDGGQFETAEAAVTFGLGAVEEGAAILDIGGQSTRPGAADVTPAEEQDRVLPVIAALAVRTEALISIDTYHTETARLAVAAGAHIVNDISGGTAEPDILSVTARSGSAYCLMHTSRRADTLSDPVADQFAFLEPALKAARAAGIVDNRLVIDPGFGFGKGSEDNLEIMAHLERLHELRLPLLIGTSRKRFVAALAGADDNLARDFATAATTALLRLAGGAIFRVHNVAANRAALAAADAIISRRYGDRS
ncbi:dihydropteroate synthase [Martelella mediterranea]|uniref:Dihydropteroate synthase n=1 Tax=Martelella mediterranea DSM 17316 TaxID=1122214 RepID=A0A1U9Z4T3_9HYPH|nr:dihydropteroate synthase [Martelella mediterranea]AQZ52674.1 Dihydropteroate synthase [Martelella mediterranea DSM 17316]